MVVAICIVTYQRPGGLKRLLDGLNQLQFNTIDAPAMEIIVVDNDAAGTAKPVCELMRVQLRWPLSYAVEPHRGISYARNCAVACVRADTDFVAFIDDDEVPDPRWLEELLQVQDTYAADVVAGPVLPYFPDRDTPRWAIEGKFFELCRYPTGHPLEVAFTNNVLLRADILRTIDQAFDERFALTGGEDSHFFMRVHRLGYRMVWADEAIVQEWIPISRINLGWILRRGYRTWSTHSFCEREFDPSLRIQSIRALKGLFLIAYGLFLLPPSLILRRHFLIKALLYIYRGCGTFSGLIGRRYEEYRTIHTV